MNNNTKIYQELLKEYTADELADAIMIPADEATEVNDAARSDFAAFRLARLAEMSEREKLLAGLLGLKYQIRAYTSNYTFDPSRSFANVLQTYLELTGRSQRQFAADIDIHPSRLNRILKGKERIGKHIAFRLEKHSGHLIPALYWWKLMQKEIEQEILTDTEGCASEQMHVHYMAYEEGAPAAG